jgi:hypothetical protein
MQDIIKELGSALAVLSTSRHPDDGVTDTLLRAMSSLTRYSRELDVRIESHAEREAQALALVHELEQLTRKQRAAIETMRAAAAAAAAAKAADTADAARAKSAAEALAAADREREREREREKERSARGALITLGTNTHLTIAALDARAVREEERTQEMHVLLSSLAEKDKEIARLHRRLAKREAANAGLKQLLERSQELLDASQYQHASRSPYASPPPPLGE